METITITKEAFDAYEPKAKIIFIDEMRQSLGTTASEITIGNTVFRDRESLQSWQIEMNYI